MGATALFGTTPSMVFALVINPCRQTASQAASLDAAMQWLHLQPIPDIEHRIKVKAPAGPNNKQELLCMRDDGLCCIGYTVFMQGSSHWPDQLHEHTQATDCKLMGGLASLRLCHASHKASRGAADQPDSAP